MCRQFYSKRDNANLILNSPRGRPGGSFWYEIWPGMAFHMLVDQYPGHEEIGILMLLNAEHWLQAFNGLSNGRAYHNFDFTASDSKTGQGVYKGPRKEKAAEHGHA